MNKLGSDCCFAGKEGDPSYEPKGSIITLNGVKVYKSKPILAGGAKGLLLFLPDAFGLAQHNRILADEYAANGFETFLVDYFEDNALPVVYMSYTPGTDIENYTHFSHDEKEAIRRIDLSRWVQNHNPTKIWSLLSPVVENLQAAANSECRLFTVGHCFGGKYAINLAKATVSAAVVFHPSFLEPSDLTGLTKPLFVGCAETDALTPTLVTDLLPALRSSTALYHLSVYGKTKHGFASRADATDPTAQKILQESFLDSINWLERLKFKEG